MEELLEKLRKAYCHIDYFQFLERTGFVDSQYAIDKFQIFKEAINLITKFDSQTLEKIIE